MQATLLFYLVWGLLVLNVLGQDVEEPIYTAYGPGNVLIGILLPCHRKVSAIYDRIRPDSYPCSDFDDTSFLNSLAIIHEIEEINASKFLPNVSLGYLMCDTCSYASKALQSLGHILGVDASINVTSNDTEFRPSVKIILGAQYSETSVAVARLLNVYMIPLLSSMSSSPELSDKERYPVFLRTIPSDIHQTKAVAKVMKHYNWTWVGVVYGDDEYGKAAFQSFLREAEDNSVCLAYQEVLPHYLDHPHSAQIVKAVAEKIYSSNAQVVLLIIKEDLVELLFKEMIRTNTTKTWFASDVWSRSVSLRHMKGINKVGDILGFSFITGESKSFDTYLENLTVTPGGYNHYIEKYKSLIYNCTPECLSSKPPSHCHSSDLAQMNHDKLCNFNSSEEQSDYLSSPVDTSLTFLHRVAVRSVAHALKKLLKCNSSSCSGDLNFAPWELLKELKKVKFGYDKMNFSFDQYGDVESGYELIKWEKHGERRSIQRIGEYSVLDEQIHLSVENVFWYSSGNITVPQSRCSPSCRHGSVKKILNVSCCYSCIKCLEGTYSDALDLDECKTCPNDTWSLKGSNSCSPRLESYLKWSDTHPIVVIASAAFGILLLLCTLIIFCVYRSSPTVLQAGWKLSCVMMAGLAVSFTSVLFFWGKPNLHLCRSRQVIYAMGFTLCVASILVKAYRMFLEFLPFGRLKRNLFTLYKPPVIVSTVTTGQGIICLLWLIFDSPDVDEKPPSEQSMIKTLQCTEGQTYIGFGIMLSYIALLVLVCFIFAFKGRRVPQQFSETGQIIFSMLMYLFVWVCFIPVYITRNEEATLLQASAILVSCYGIIFCHFVPQCWEAIRRSRSAPQPPNELRTRNSSRRSRSFSSSF